MSTVKDMQDAFDNWSGARRWQFHIIPMGYGWGEGIMGVVVDIKNAKTLTMAPCNESGTFSWDIEEWVSYLDKIQFDSEYDTPDGVQEFLEMKTFEP